jgi:hypothetical protein
MPMDNPALWSMPGTRSMLHPLVTLWRHSTQVTFFESGNALDDRALFAAHPGPRAPGPSRARSFMTPDEASQYLRFWLADTGACAELRWMLNRGSMALTIQSPSANDWMEELAARLYGGTLVVIEETARPSMPGRLVIAPSAASSSLAGLAPLSSLPSVPAAVDLLPALEDVQIEGAEVKPEIDESIEQVNASLGAVNSASTSLAPAPSKVGDIRTSMQERSSDIQDKLGSV